MWKVFLIVVCIVFGFAGYWFYSEIQKDKVRMEDFRRSWDTEVVGIVDSVDLFTGDAGVIYFKVNNIKGKQYDISSYSGGPFYLLTNGHQGKLIEGGMHRITKGDLLMITDQKDFIIIRNNQVVLLWPIYFRDVPVLWKNADMDELKNFWSW